MVIFLVRKPLAPILVFICLSLPARAFGQDNKTDKACTPAQGEMFCPSLVVICPDMFSGGQVAFQASVTGVTAETKLSFKWLVSEGRISQGQGTSTIIVDTSDQFAIELKQLMFA